MTDTKPMYPTGDELKDAVLHYFAVQRYVGHPERGSSGGKTCSALNMSEVEIGAALKAVVEVER